MFCAGIFGLGGSGIGGIEQLIPEAFLPVALGRIRFFLTGRFRRRGCGLRLRCLFFKKIKQFSFPDSPQARCDELKAKSTGDFIEQKSDHHHHVFHNLLLHRGLLIGILKRRLAYIDAQG